MPENKKNKKNKLKKKKIIKRHRWRRENEPDYSDLGAKKINKIKHNLEKFGIKIKKIKKIKENKSQKKQLIQEKIYKTKIDKAEGILGRGHFSQISQKSGKIRTAESAIIVNKIIGKRKKVVLKDFTEVIKRPNFHFIKNKAGKYEYYQGGKYVKNICNKTRIKLIRAYEKKELIRILRKFDMNYKEATKFISRYKKEKVKQLRVLKKKKIINKIRPHLHYSIKILSDILGERIESF